MLTAQYLFFSGKSMMMQLCILPLGKRKYAKLEMRAATSRFQALG